MYSKTEGTVVAETGEQFTLIVQHVDIDPTQARILFNIGREVGDWGWKHKVWTCQDIQRLEEIRAAARFFYGWAEGTETVTSLPDGRYQYEARYAC